MFLIVSLAANHFGRHGALLVTLICTTQALSGAALGIGFFGRDFANTHLLNFWTYTLVLTFLGFYLSANIEEKIRTYQSLKISRNRYRGVLQNMMDAYFRLDIEGRILEANSAMSHMTGYSVEELLNMNVSEIEVIESHDETQRHIQKILEEGHDLFESKHRRKDGKIIDVEINSYLSSDNLLNVYAFHRDISQRKRLENIVALESSRLKTLLETASDGIHVMDQSGNLVQFSNAFCSMLGYSWDETKKLNILDWDCNFSEAEIFNAFENLPENPISFETKHRRKDGSTFDVEITTRKIVLEGQSYIYASSRDITERKLAAQELSESRNLLKAIIDSVPVRVFWKDKDLRYLGCNPAFAKDAGVAKPDELIGKRDT
jgi:PAS domain S-box-containing protein